MFGSGDVEGALANSAIYLEACGHRRRVDVAGITAGRQGQMAAQQCFVMVNWGIRLSATAVGQTRKSRRDHVGATDKAKNKLDEIGGKAKEKLGQATGDTRTEHEGKGDQIKSNLKDAGEKVKDAFSK
jgi:uncharacterized protein YjbJ (UPF0337 family)